ncbi:DUF1442 domain-containing protein [Endozoicomonas sp. G2_2]|uniref:O-methyltransferase n=1 Tax=Endozoicomonas sp. G2_2 TaxID=2821092 RepID=UPI001ADC99F9|nr:class I SAM-dependent methyltransferase [Endozoicomonas sp. G2_2]MBO9468898.1 DUF1442 domain-containing protein [Endozoicomonas sp. G2_2]
MGERIEDVLAHYDELLREERAHRDDPAVQRDRHTDRDRRLLAVGPHTGRLINVLARSLDAPHILELGTSYGYSTIWLGEAARAAGGRVTTMEMQDYKSRYARDMAARAGLDSHIDFQVGDAVEMIDELTDPIDFVLLDLWKDLYMPCLKAFYPKLAPGAIVVADNMLRPGGENVQRYGQAVRAKAGIDSVLLPVGSGLEVSRLASA